MKKNTDGEKTEYGLLVNIKANNTNWGETHYNIYTVTVVALPEYGKVWGLGTHDLEGFTLRGQQDSSTDGTRIYSQSAYFDGHYIVQIDMAKAEAMLTILKRVNRYMDKAVESRGRATDFAEYVLRVALALGIKTIVRHTPNSASGYDYQFLTLGEGADHIRYEERTWMVKYESTLVTA